MRKIFLLIGLLLGFCLIGSAQAQENETQQQEEKFPLAYPFSSWGEIRWQDSDVEESLIGDGYFEPKV